jgi:hypothetical protein
MDTAYLAVFGAMQALVVQQDAMHYLATVLGHPHTTASSKLWPWLKAQPPLDSIRELRNASVGHPVNVDKGPATGAFFIVQHSLSVRGFQLLGPDSQWVSVPVYDFAVNQVGIITSELRRAAQEVANVDREHRRLHMPEKLVAIFEELNYPLEKLAESCGAISPRDPRGAWGLACVRKSMQVFRAKMEARGEPFDRPLEYIGERIEAACQLLDRYLAGDTLEAPLPDILATFIADRVNELKRIAAEIDDEYSADLGATSD